MPPQSQTKTPETPTENLLHFFNISEIYGFLVVTELLRIVGDKLAANKMKVCPVLGFRTSCPGSRSDRVGPA